MFHYGWFIWSLLPIYQQVLQSKTRLVLSEDVNYVKTSAQGANWSDMDIGPGTILQSQNFMKENQ